MLRRKVILLKLRMILAPLSIALFAFPTGAWAGDPLDDVDGTEGWDQVVRPRQKQERQADLERNTFKREVEDWEAIRQAWQEEREKYITEKSNQQRMLHQLRADRRPPPAADITENSDNSGDWGDQPGESLFQPTGSIDRAIDDELGETGAVPSRSTKKSTPSATTDGVRDSGAGAQAMPDPYALRRERDQDEARKRKTEQDQAQAAALKIEQEKERQKQAELSEKKRQEEERLRKEQEAKAGEAAAAALLKQQEEQMRKEQEALRKKAKLNVDNEGQVVDPELQREMQDEPDSNEDTDN